MTTSIRHIIIAAMVFFTVNAYAQTPEGTATIRKGWNLNLKTNTLYDFAGCPNIGVDVRKDCWAFQTDWIFAWWNHPATHHYYSNYGIQSEIRYYVPQWNHQHVGLYGHLVTYDFEFGGVGHLARKLKDSFGIGAAYGYEIYLTADLNLDFTVGLGYFQSRYDKYEPSYFNSAYYRTATGTLRYFGPTRLEVGLIWKLKPQFKK